MAALRADSTALERSRALRGARLRWFRAPRGPHLPHGFQVIAAILDRVEITALLWIVGATLIGILACVWRLPEAGHDAAQMAALVPVAMLFVRCEEGISHNPAESVAREDVEVAVGVLQRFLRLIAEAH